MGVDLGDRLGNTNVFVEGRPDQKAPSLLVRFDFEVGIDIFKGFAQPLDVHPRNRIGDHLQVDRIERLDNTL